MARRVGNFAHHEDNYLDPRGPTEDLPPIRHLRQHLHLNTETNIMFRAVLFIWLLAIANSAYCATWQIDFGSLGPIRIGMTPNVVRAVKGAQQEKGDTFLKNVSSYGCDVVHLTDVHLQFDRGRLDEIRTGSRLFKMSNGIGVGSTYNEIVRVFGTDNKRVKIGDNHYDDFPQLTVEAPLEIRQKFGGRKVSIQFEFERGPLTAGSRVTSISIGHHWVEGCA